MAGRKPYRSMAGFDQFGDEWDYKDLIKKSLVSEDVADNLASSSTIIYSSYTFPLTTKGDLLGHDGSAVVRKGVGANKTALVADSSTSDGLAWRTLNTTKGDLLGYDTDLKRVPIGTNDHVLMADSAQTLGLKWTALTASKGDILSHNGSDPAALSVGSDGKVLGALASETTGLKWQTKNSINLGLGGDWIYGDGVDGDLVLVADTAIAADDNRKMYSSIDLAGWSLTYNVADFYLSVYCSGLCDGNAGRIHSQARDNSTPGTGGAAAGLPSGGNGGDGAGALYVYAKTMADITIDCSGVDGSAGGDAQHPASVAGVNPAGGSSSSNIKFRGVTLTIGTNATGGSTVGGYGIVSTGGTGMTVTAANRASITRHRVSALELILPLTAYGGSANDFDSNTAARSCYSAAGAGGAGGSEDNVAAFGHVSGGGGGGGGAGLWANGGAGGDGVLSTLGNNERSAGGGGGGGGGGSHAVVITNDGSAVVVDCSGGNGGGGGTGSDDGANTGDGGGGGGGLAVGIGTGMTVVADGGTAGATGNGGTNGTAGSTFYVTRA